MNVVFWIMLLLASPVVGMKAAQLQNYYKRRKVLTRDQREMAIGALIMFLGSLGALLFALYNIWFR